MTPLAKRWLAASVGVASLAVGSQLLLWYGITHLELFRDGPIRFADVAFLIGSYGMMTLILTVPFSLWALSRSRVLEHSRRSRIGWSIVVAVLLCPAFVTGLLFVSSVFA